MARRLRIPPSGVLIKDETSGAGPLEEDNGRAGLVFRAHGLRGAANTALTGAANQLLEFQNPAAVLGTGPAITQLPWTLSSGYLWQLEVMLPIRNVPASVGQVLSGQFTARNVSTGLRETLYNFGNVTVPDGSAGLGDFFFNWNINEYRLLFANNDVDHDQVQFEVNSAAAFANFAIINDLTRVRLSQYSVGSL